MLDVLEGDVSKAKREAFVEFWKKKIEEAVQVDLDWSDEQLAEDGELEAKRRRRSTCLSPKLIAGPRQRSAESRTRRTRRRSRTRVVWKNFSRMEMR